MSAISTQHSVILGELCSPLVFPRAIKYIRRMHGGSQSALMQCDDGCYYIVKMSGNPQGHNILANEYLGASIAFAVGLPVAKSSFIRITADFIKQTPGLGFATVSGISQPTSPGLHHGSLLIGDLEGPMRPTEYISRAQAGSIGNRDAFLGMYILDVWANHQDMRQALLLATHPDLERQVVFIDHGHMFGGPAWQFKERPGVMCHAQPSVYKDLWSAARVAVWISLFEKVIPATLARAVTQIPPRWYNDDIRALRTVLMQRLSNLNGLLELHASAFGRIDRRSLAYESGEVQLAGTHLFRTASQRDSLRCPSV